MDQAGKEGIMKYMPSCIPVALTSILIITGAWQSQAETISTGPENWTVIRDSVSLSSADPVGSHSKGSLCITGRFVDGSASAVSDPVPMTGFTKYRFNASMRVDRFEADRANPFSNIPLPFLRCEFLTDEPGGILGSQVISIASWKWGQWLSAAGEFRAPWGTARCRIVIADEYAEWGKNIPFGVTFAVDGITIEPVERFTVEGVYRLAPAVKKRLSRSDHPRLYLDGEGFGTLRGKIGGSHSAIWQNVHEQADELLTHEPPAWRSSGSGVYDEQWWMGGNGRSMITLAMAWRMTGDRAYLENAEKWALATCAYPSWCTGWAANIDCMTGHNLFGLAVIYDWLYHDLDTQTLATIRKTLEQRASHLFDRAASGTIVPSRNDFAVRPWPEWEEVWLQNHLWVNATGLLAAGLALIGETPEAEEWAAFALDRFQHTMQYLGPDGASHEGINYWSYGLEHLLKSMYLSRSLLGVDMYDNDWFRNTAQYRLYSGIPKNAWEKGSTTINYGDSHPRDSVGPDYLLRALAAEYRYGYAQRLAREIGEAGVQNAGNSWLDLIWYDPMVTEKDYHVLPTLHHFTDMDFVSARSDWSGEESFLFYKCGPYIGEKGMETMNYCASSAHHTHPDQNSFMLHGCGEWLIRDDGNYGKYTGQHNTLIIDGGEQLGGGDSIFDGVELHAMKQKPHVITALSTPSFDHIAGDASQAYPRVTGLRRFTRHLLYLKPNVLIVADDIALDAPHDLELRFHPGFQEAVESDGTFIIKGDSSTLRIEPLTREGATSSAYNHELIDRRYNKSEMLAIGLKTRQAEWRNAVALSWSLEGREPASVTMHRDGGIWSFITGSRTVILDWTTGEAHEQ